jgi:CRP/FNR family transcriptional regulator, cyclic AMP receptor protein
MPQFTDDEPSRKPEGFDYRALAAKYSGVTTSKFAEGDVVFAQGDPVKAVYYIISGSFKVTIVSEHGKEAVIAMLRPGDFFGEGCLDGQLLQNSTIASTAAGEIVRFDRATMLQAFEDDPAFSNLFLRFILDRNQKLQADLVDQLFNSSEKRLARILTIMASVAHDSQPTVIAVPLTQETLANMVGTTRSRINQFMTKFRKLGYIDYNGHIKVHNSLFNIITDTRLHDPAC